MHVRAVGSAAGAGDHLVLRTASGIVCGTWRSSEPVDAGAEFDVELDVPGSVAATAVRVDATVGPSFECGEQGTATIRGVVLDIDHDDVLTLRVDDAVVMVEIDGELPLGIVGAQVRLGGLGLEIHPTHV